MSIKPYYQNPWLTVWLADALAVNKCFTDTVKICESPIERIIEHELAKFIWSGLTPQFEVPPYRLDFRMEFGRRVIGLECDGREFHDPTSDRDLKRDIDILSRYPVDVIYRAWGKSIYSHVHDVLDLLAIREPALFSESVKRVFEGHRTRWCLQCDHLFIPSRAGCYSDLTRTFHYEEKDEDGELLPIRAGSVSLRWITKEQAMRAK
jgi:hypothetical protein